MDNFKELRNEVRNFIDEEKAKGTFEPQCDSWLGGVSTEFSHKLGKRGWVGMTWPKKYGGSGKSALARFVVTEELLAAGAPIAAHWVADRQSGALLLKYGTEEQRKYYLPKIASGESYFVIGLSEPNSGSDLASLSTVAEKVDGGWVLNGSKLWTSGAHYSHYMIGLVRTSPQDSNNRHGGLSQFIIDLTNPGVTVRPIHLMTGEHHFNEVILDNVFIPENQIVGEIGNGWTQGMAELAYERSGPERFLSTFPLLVELLRVIQVDPDRFAKIEVGKLVSRLWILRKMSISVATLLENGETPNLMAALVKDLGTQFEKQIAETSRLLVSSNPSVTSPFSSAFERRLAEAILHSPGFTLRGGTTEILRGIIAKEVVAK
ncbi:acyl-CoA dehydrogenase [Planococcus salinus]|uniref:Acyl-CoA dehydrogenase n=1 Tax=Planococcus salinus TaxID=1848460 RepID=A0A3M8P8D2_9BACL|nr:acyl-CoA dehydrogenase [Planococcus salinus]